MSKLRFLTAGLAAILCALGLSVGAALAEGQHAAAAPTQKGASKAPSGVCILHDLKLKH